jgi:hypothetical protein
MLWGRSLLWLRGVRFFDLNLVDTHGFLRYARRHSSELLYKSGGHDASTDPLISCSYLCCV